MLLELDGKAVFVYCGGYGPEGLRYVGQPQIRLSELCDNAILHDLCQCKLRHAYCMCSLEP